PHRGGDGPVPVVVGLHGGGWRMGKRQDLAKLTELLAAQGFAAATVTYRLAPQHRFPAQVEDCKAAVRWLRANARKFKLNPDRVGAVGFSAGAHLACLLGTAGAGAGLEGDGGHPAQPGGVQPVVGFFGPTAFTTKPWRRAVEALYRVPFLGGTSEEKAELYKKASPIVYVGKGGPPFLFFHGTEDKLVGIDNSR